MRTMPTFFMNTTIVIVAIGMTPCSDMSWRGTDTVIGAGGGGVAGAVLTGGRAMGAVGGVVGNQVGK